MADRFQRLFTLTPNLYIEGCPVIIEAGALLKDTESGAVLAQIKMRNIGVAIITSCKIAVEAFATNGEEVEGVTDFSYLDLNANRGQEFGSKIPVMLPDRTARKIAVDIKEIVFSDGTVKKIESNEWKQAPKQESIDETLQDKELAKQYRIEVGENADFFPEKKEGLFLCTCGAINLDSAEPCYKCGRSYEFLNSRLNENYLAPKIEERHNAEATQKNKQQAIKKKSIKIATIVGSVVIAIVLITALVNFIGSKKEQKEIAQQSVTVVQNKLAKTYTTTGIGKKKAMTLQKDGFVVMSLLNSNGKAEYTTVFRYEIRKKDDGNIVIDFVYPKGKVNAEYILTGTDGSWITEIKFDNTTYKDWEWKGTYKKQ